MFFCNPTAGEMTWNDRRNLDFKPPIFIYRKDFR